MVNFAGNQPENDSLNSQIQKNSVANQQAHMAAHASINLAATLNPNIYNFDPSYYNYARKGFANTKAGISNSYVLHIGDSTTAGYNETGGTNEIIYSAPTRLAQFINSSGTNSGWQNGFGDHNNGDAVATDNRFSALPSGWISWNGSNGGVCGRVFANLSGNQNKLQFTPTVQTDTCEIMYLDDASGLDNINVFTGAGGVTVPTTGSLITITGTNLIKTAIATTTLGTNIWGVAKATLNASSTFILGFNAYNSANKEIQMLNFGCHGYKTADFLPQTLTSGNYFLGSQPFISAGSSFYGAPLAFINLGLNDGTNTVPATTYQANLDSLVSSLRAGGTDVVLVVPIPTSSANISLALQAQYQAAIYALADKYKVAVIDIAKRWTSYAVSQPLGYYRGSNDVHGSKQGYADIAMAQKQILAQLALNLSNRGFSSWLFQSPKHNSSAPMKTLQFLRRKWQQFKLTHNQLRGVTTFKPLRHLH